MLNRHRIGLFLMPIFLGGALGMAQNAAPLPQMDFKRLMNNLQVTVASAPSLGDVATIGLVVRYGSAFDPAEKGGVAYLLSRMFLRATADKSLKDIQGELEYLGQDQSQSWKDPFSCCIKSWEKRGLRNPILLQ
jgi:hypothetical protein